MRGPVRPSLRRRFLAIVALLTVSVVSACSQSSRFATPGAQGETSALKPVELAVDGPSNGATQVSTTPEISVQTNGVINDIHLVAGDGTKIAGSFPWGNSQPWLPDKQLNYSTHYTLKIISKKGAITKKHSSKFTTMVKPIKFTDTTYRFLSGGEFGVGMPLGIQFGRDIPEDNRAALERRMFVTAQPATEGAWSWITASEVHWRPKDFWKPGTKVSGRLAIGGLEAGNGSYINADRKFDVRIGSSTVTKIDNATKKMQVYQNGELAREFPISLGKPGHETSSGVMVVMEKAASKMFDSSTYGVPVDSPEGYRMDVKWDVRFTWGGEFVHAAPWSVQDQGQRNVSHGCVNASEENAKWFFDISQVGDVIEVVGTGNNAELGNAWNVWDLSWEEWLEGSALHQQEIQQQTSPNSSPVPSGKTNKSPEND